MARRDWYMCEKCYNQGWVLPNGTPDPDWAGGCKCEGITFLTGPHNWIKMQYKGNILYQNTETDLLNHLLLLTKVNSVLVNL